MSAARAPHQLEEDGLGWSEEERRSPERARDARARQLSDRDEVGAGEPPAQKGPESEGQARQSGARGPRRGEGPPPVGTAGAADEVAVPVRVGEMPSRHAVLEVRMCDEAELLERLEVAVDGRWIDLRVLTTDPRRDLFGRRVMLRLLQCLEDEAALDGHALARRAHAPADALGGGRPRRPPPPPYRNPPPPTAASQ